MKNFFRKVALGVGPNEKVPSNPLNWALSQFNKIPDLSWQVLLKKLIKSTSNSWQTIKISSIDF